MYATYPFDQWLGVPQLAAFVFGKQVTATQLRVVLARLPTSPSTFVIQFADDTGVGLGPQFFNVYWQSNFTLTKPLTNSFGPLLNG